MALLLPKKIEDRIDNVFYLYKEGLRFWDGTRSLCLHKKRIDMCKICKELKKKKNIDIKHVNNGILNLPTVKERKKDTFYIFENELRVWNGTELLCEHKKPRRECVECNGSNICKHKVRRRTCKDCNGSGICEHEIRRARCIPCGGSSLCKGCKKRYGMSDKYVTEKKIYVKLCSECFYEQYPNEKKKINKTEWLLFDYIKDNYKNYTVERQKKFKWCINPENNYQLTCDFYIPELKLVIELNGQQHYIQVSNWDPPEEIQKRDKIKKHQILNNGLNYYVMYQPDVWFNKNMWKEKLDLILKT